MRIPHLPRAVLVAAAAIAAAAIAVVPVIARIRTAVSRLRTSSSPSVRLYEALAGALLGGLYRRIATDVAATLETVDADILEVGPGPGHLAVEMSLLLPRARITALDLDPGMLERARARLARAGLDGRVRLVAGDVAAMPLGDAAFDVVVSSFSAHHWSDPGGALREVRRVLRPGGRALLYDLPDGWGRFETGAPSLAEEAVRAGWPGAASRRVSWPATDLSIVRVVELAEAAPA